MIHPFIDMPSYAWYRATWRNLAPQPRPEPQPFDVDAKLKYISKLQTWRWDRIWPNPSPIISADEATFWIYVFSSVDSFYTTPAKVSATIAQRWADKSDLRLDKYWFGVRSVGLPPQAVIPLYNLTPLDQLVRLLRMNSDTAGREHAWTTGWWQFIVPILTESERSQLRDIIAPDMRLGLRPQPQSYGAYQSGDAYPMKTLQLAASLGGYSAELENALAILPDDFFAPRSTSYHYPAYYDLMFGLDDPAKVQREMTRLKGKPYTQAHVFGWYAHTESDRLDLPATLVREEGQRGSAQTLIKMLTIVKTPAMARVMLDLHKNSKVPAEALQWLNDNPELSIQGLHEPAANGNASARKVLKRLARHGHEARLREVNPALAALLLDVDETSRVPKFSAENTPEWLAPTVKGKLPVWADAEDLPIVVIDSHQLTSAQRRSLLVALSKCKLVKGELKTHPLVDALREHGDPIYLDQFAWALFDTWVGMGAMPKGKWALLTVGLLGGDSCALRLTPLVRKWPGESQHQRAVLGLECLRMIGSDTALMQINGLATKNKFQGLKKQARLAMERIAEARGLSSDQLSDRIIPDCGLSETGQRVFDYGVRSFSFVLSDEMKPVVRDEKGKVRANLPKPGKRDDAVKATAAYEEWKLLKKQVRDVAKVQAERLKQAMIAQRRWSSAEFGDLYVRHPLMTHLCQRLLWGAFDASGELIQTLRVTDERDFADLEDEPVDLAESTAVGLIHPLQLTSAERSEWGELLADYDIIPPFPQLGRRINLLTDEEREADVLHRLDNLEIPSISLRGIVERNAWVRDTPADAGGFYGHSRQFPFANVTAVITYEEGMFVGGYDMGDDQRVSGCFFVPGLYEPRMYPEHKVKVPLADVDPVVMSEVLSLLYVLADKAV